MFDGGGAQNRHILYLDVNALKNLDFGIIFNGPIPKIRDFPTHTSIKVGGIL